jgi:hypothetical protein
MLASLQVVEREGGYRHEAHWKVEHSGDGKDEDVPVLLTAVLG